MKTCPKCFTHPELVDSGWRKLSKRCPVCDKRYKSNNEVIEEKAKAEANKRTAEENQRYMDQWWNKIRGGNTNRESEE